MATNNAKRSFGSNAHRQRMKNENTRRENKLHTKTEKRQRQRANKDSSRARRLAARAVNQRFTSQAYAG